MPFSKKKQVNHFIAMWDMQGLECIFDVNDHMAQYNEWEKQKIVSILKEERVPNKPQGIPLQMMILRARANSQRSYEIYEFTSLVSMEEVKEAFDSNPQPLVEWIRDNGKKVYSNYVKQNRKMIV
jgi:hypothetical protein